MSSLEDNMEEMLNISVDVDPVPSKPVPPKVDKDDRVKDYEYTRGELYSLIDQGQEAVRGALEVAQESGHPRACLLYTSPSPRDRQKSRMPSSA